MATNEATAEGSNPREADQLFPPQYAGDALASITSAEVDKQIATAKRFPRDVARVARNILTTACLDQETADSCYYRLERMDRRTGKKKIIEGESVRLAEIFASCMGNVFMGKRAVAVEDKFVRAQGFCWDLENNVRMVCEVTRRITTSSGARYGDDMIATTMAAAASIGHRNSCLATLPRAILKSVEKDIRAKALGDEKTLPERRQAAVDWFAEKGVTEEQLLKYVERSRLSDVSLIDLQKITMLRNGIRDGMVSLQEAFESNGNGVSGDALKAGSHTFTRNGKKSDETKPADATTEGPGAADTTPEGPAEKSAPAAEQQPPASVEPTKPTSKGKGKARRAMPADGF